MSENLIGGLIPFGIGSLMTLIALIVFIRTRVFLNSAQSAQGTVIQMVYRHSSKGGGGYSPVYSFRTITGQEVIVQDGLSSSPPQFQVGQQIEVYYDPENPQNARINKWLNLYFLPMLLGFLGLVFGGVGFFLLLGEILKMFK